MNVLLISEDYIKSTTNIGDNVSGDFLLPAISLAQDIELTECIGTPLLEKLQELIETNVINNDDNKHYKYLLDKYLQPFLAYATMHHVITPLAYKLANAGILRTEDEKMYNISADEVDKLKYHYKHLSDLYQYRLQRYLIGNYNKFPELLRYKSISDIRANLYSSASVGLWLGGARSKYVPNETYNFGYGLPSSTIEVL